MTLPYKSRIVAFINGEPFELARFRRAPSSCDIRLITRSLSCMWRHEKTLRDYETITSRWSHPGGSAGAANARAAHARGFKQ